MIATASLSATQAFGGPLLAGIPVEFLLFAVLLLSIAFIHVNTMLTAVAGAFVISLYKVFLSPFGEGAGLEGLLRHFSHEWVMLANLLGLLLGFALLARHFELSEVPAILPNYLPDDWKGGFLLLILVFAMSSFLDNIAAAMIGGAVAHTVFRGKVHIGYLASIVAAANAGGSGSVVGDTTTTMMWIAGIAPIEVSCAYVAAGVALLVTAIPASFQQHAYSPIAKDARTDVKIDWARVGIVAFILIIAILINVLMNLNFKEIIGLFPFLGLAVCAAIAVTAPLRQPDWKELPGALSGAIFLLALVWCASMMPVEKLPQASWQTALSLGFVSAVFDNIPMTALALKQGGFDWGYLAYAVGFGGSMIWFGSSAGVAVTNMYPESKSVFQWIVQGWHVILAYVAGFFVMLLLTSWHVGTEPLGSAKPRIADAANNIPAPPPVAGSGLKMPGTASLGLKLPQSK